MTEDNIRVYFKPAIDRIWFLVLFVLITTLGSYYYFSVRQPIYQSIATVMVSKNTPGQVLDSQVILVTQQIAETFARVAKSQLILSQAGQRARVSEVSDDNVNVLVIPRTQLIKIIVKDENSTNAAAIANAIVAELIIKIVDLQSSISPQNQAILEIVEPAKPEEKPVFPRMLLVEIASLSLSFIVGLLIIYICELFDTSVKSAKDIRKELPNIPVIATIPTAKNQTDAEALKAVRLLRNNFLFIHSKKVAKVVVVTSPNNKDGKTYVSTKLALILSRSEKKVLIIDANLKRNGLTKNANLHGNPGLYDILKSDAKIEIDKLPVSKWYDDVGLLSVMACGQVVPDCGEILLSSRMKELLKLLRASNRFDYVIIDSPSAFESSDAFTLAPETDGIIVVVKSHKTSRYQLSQVYDQSVLENFNIIGVVINKSKQVKHYYYHVLGR